MAVCRIGCYSGFFVFFPDFMRGVRKFFAEGTFEEDGCL